MPPPGTQDAHPRRGLNKKLDSLASVSKPKIIIGVLLLAIFLGGLWGFLGLAPDPLAQANWPWTTYLTDRHNFTIAAWPGPKGYRETRDLKDYPPLAIEAVLSAEDRAFYRHFGVNPLACLRAMGQNIKARSWAFGCSTITMQLARLSLGLTPGPRTFRRKLKELWLALLIERRHSKETILAAYLNAAPTGPQRWGLATAAKEYLGKDITLISPGEAAFLASLPKYPSLKEPRKILKRRDNILKTLNANGFLDKPALARALETPIWPNLDGRPYQAPHFLAYLKRTDFPKDAPLRAELGALKPSTQTVLNQDRAIKTTLDLELQKEVERQVSELVDLKSPQGLTQAAVVVMSLPQRQILAWVGSVDFYDQEEGQNDGVLALRQPGSALKPFIYQLAISEGLITAGSLLSDQPKIYSGSNGSFRPRNYGGTYHGPISARQALASSLNLPAVELIKAIGTKKTLAHLRSLGLASLKDDSDYYGLGLALGNGEVSLLALTNAYALLALGGRPPTLNLNDAAPPPKLDAASAFIVSDILSDDKARILGFGRHGLLDTPYPTSVKTGTSQNFRDNWTIGYADHFVIGVWAGNFQSNPMTQVSGITGAGQLWRGIADYLAKRQEPKAPIKPIGLTQAYICPLSGLLVGPKCPNGVLEYFLTRHPLPGVCDHDHLGEPAAPNMALTIISPPNRQVYGFDPDIHPTYQKILAKAQAGPEIETVRWILNGETIGQGLELTLPLKPGAARLLALGFKGQNQVAQAETRFLVK
ncbi:MAG: penicillin-binding protein 1C [Deltaproteobacteria bacterium]|jgi:penicillin-binding protein 1C|nr:penicillin-binding protein 1C [Deltaproteobacteria bacterium]